jgi:hypothetical protein
MANRPRTKIAFAALLVAAATLVGLSAQAPAAVRTPVKCYGIWRWKTKTLADKPKLTATVVDKDVAYFQNVKASQPLSKTTPRISPHETTIYRVTGILKYARHVDDPADAQGKNGGDLDYHLVIADTTTPPPGKTRPTMIVEFPDPHCTVGATQARRDQMKTARAAFSSACHGAPKHDFANLQGQATITGVGFYDEPHAKGRAPHGAELHPVLSFTSTNCKWVP